MVVLFALVALAVLAAVAGLHWYLWRRLVRDTTRGPGPARRAGTAVFTAGPLLAVGALVAERTGAPFWLQRTLAWPGFLWLALSLYLLLTTLATEPLRPLLHRVLRGPAGPPHARPTEQPTSPSLAAPGENATISPLASPGGNLAGTPFDAPGGNPVGSPLGRQGRVAGGRGTGVQGAEPPGTPAAAPAGQDPTRRLFVARLAAGAAATIATATVGHGTYGVLRGPRINRVTVPLAKLPRAAHGFRIAVVSDIHLGPVLGRGFAQRVVDTVNATQPDLIAVVGDLVDGSVKDLGPAAAPLAGLRARHGAYFVTGNHEYFSGAEQWVEEVRGLGLHPLQNARTELPSFDLAGVNDLQGESEGQGPDFGRALGDRDPARACVLLAHQPVQIHEAVRHGVDLQLSGHTHGGQLWPGSLLAAAANPTVAGLERYGDTQLYVSRGAGAWGPPTRVGAPSDVTVIELAALRA
ncbi:metallophosphoesterase [Streptomyces actinomycinicus]|uniref:Metallophosphoesterase n=1 Tax=Streptomyces actinomycinicus TaxID=1695166 RepID=A0A937JMJ6_9ACTN|nr:metallophosphoesterase [Streptomyces actinomycinicus]MBL1081372.1 metallophosphoesterase [Streptomyces actinomycinicus]